MSSHIQKSCVGLEATLSDNKKNYGDKVNALLSAWEHVTNFIPAATPEATQSLIEWVHKHTLRLVLRGEWPKLSPATKTHLGVTLQRCATHLGHHPAASRCTTLISLVHNPWTNPALDGILNGKPDPDREEEFCCNEKGELLTTRLKILCEDRCEDIAVNLAAACVRSLKRNDRLESLCEAQHVQFMMDVYIVLLYKLKRTQDIFSQLKSMDLSEGLELVQRLSGEKLTKYGSARVWRNALKAAELVAQYLVTAGMVRPVDETGAVTLEQIINSWASLHSKLKDITPTLFGMIRKLIEPAESAQHIYIFCSVLGKHFGTGVKPLVIELYVRALTTDMNELESQKVKADKEKVRETAKRLSAEFLKLSEVVVDNVGIARECVLTAFSLHPTRNCYDRIREMAVACGKINMETERRDVLKNFLDTGQEMDTRDGHTGAPTLPQNTNTLVDRGNEAADHAGEAGNLELSRRCDYRKEEILKKLEVTRSRDTVGGTDGCLLHAKHDPASDSRLGDLCFNCGDFKGIDLTRLKAKECSRNVERTLDALILIKGDAVTGSANYDEKSAPSQVLDAEKLGVSPQLCDDLAVVLSSPRYHMLSWVLDWKELNALCEKYLENAEEMRNTNKELKYLNIDYSQFKDWPLDETKDVFFGIEKGYEQWADVPSDNSEEFGSFQPAGPYKRSLTRRSLEDTTDSDSGSMLRTRRPGRHRKIHRLESSESDYDSTERKSKHFRQDSDSVSDSDTNTQDSQTDSLGSDGCRQEKKQTSTSQKSKNLKETKKMRGKSKLTVDAMSHFHMLVNENVRQRSNDEVSSSDMSNDIITLFSADMDENKCETIKGSAYTAEAPLIITEKRSDPAVLKSLRMFRPQNSKKPTRIAQILQKNLLNKTKDNRDAASNHNKKCSPVLTSLNLNPKIILTRTDQLTKKLSSNKKLTPGDITSELINIQKTMPFSPSNNKISNIGGVSPTDKHASKTVRSSGDRDSTRPSSVGRTLNSSENLTLSAVKNLSSVKNLSNVKNLSTVKNLGGVKNMSAATKRVYSSHGKSKFDILAKAARDSDILAKSVPGLNTLDMMVPPRVRPTVNIVQLSRNISQSPNPGPPVNSGNTPPRNRDSVIGGNLQLPGTPASSGHDSGVGMSPADQTPPSRSLLHDVGEDVSQPLDTPPCVVGSSMATLADPGSPKSMRDNRTTKDSPLKDSVSPSSPPSATPTISGVSIPSEQLQIVCKPDGTYQLASVNPQRNTMTLQNFEDRIAPTFARRAQQRNPTVVASESVAASSSPACSSSTASSVVTMNRNIYDRLTSVKNLTQSGQNSTTGLPKFQQAFGKTIYTLSADTTTVAASTATETLPQLSTAAISPKTTPTTATTNLSKAVQTSVLQNNQPTNTSANVGVQSIANIGNLQLSSGRQILNIVHASDAASTANVTTTVASSNPSSLTHLVQNVQGSTPGVIYTHKIPVTISTTNPSQINIIPTISHTASSPVANRAPVVKLNIIRTASTTPIRQQNLSGAIQAVLSAPRIQQTVRHENLISSPIDVPNQVSSTTLEQLREFESVLEQVKERSTVQPQHQVLNAASAAATTTTVQTQTTNQQSKLTSSSALAQQLLVSSQSSAGEFANNSSNVVTFHPEAFPGQKVSLAYVNQTSSPVVSKVMSSSSSTPVVVVTSYCQPAASPALSVTSQSSSSPCVTPAPTSAPSAGKTTPPSSAVAVAAAAAAAAASKSAKKSTTPKTVKTSATNTSKTTTIPKPQQKPQEDEQTAQRIYAILDEYAEQLRNSPDLNNKPAPRRRSNPPTNPSQSSKRKKSTSGKSKPTGQQNSELSPSTDDLGRTMGSEDSSSGIVHIQDSPVGLSVPEEVGTPTTTGNLDVSHEIRGLLTNDSDDGVEVNLKRRNLIFADQTSGQPARAVIVQEAGQTTAVSVSEALASGKIGNAAVFVPGTNYILPVNLMKGGQQFTIVSGNSKLLATVPASVRTPNANANTLVLQSFLNQGGKIISQPINQMKQVKLPTLQTLTTGQTISTANASQQNSTMVVAQGNIASQQYLTTESNTEKNSCEAKVDSTASAESATPSTILVNKTSTIGLLQRNLNTAEFTDNQQICGVITSSQNLGLQPTRLFNSSIAKLTVPSTLKNDNVVCLGSATLSQPPEKKFSHDTAQTDKSVAIQTATIALAFASQSDVSHVNATQKDAKDNSPGNSDKSISPKTIKRKLDDDVGPTCANVVLDSLAKECVTSTFSSTSSFASTPSTSTKQSLKNDSPDVDDISSKDVTNIENTGANFLVSTSDGQDTRQSNMENNVDGTSTKVGNGMLCSNARLQEAWEPDHKTTPDTPWRYVPTSTNQLTIEPLKVYTRGDTETLESVHNIVHIMNKNQGMVEIGSSGQLYQTTNASVPTTTSPTAKKYFMNHTLEPFHQYANKGMSKSQSNPRLDRELLQQRMERKAAALERELRLQKSLSEECEDLGVDEPSTSDLFPEADLLFDTNHSPSFDHSSQDASCSQPVGGLGIKSYNTGSSYYRPLDSSSSSRDASPSGTDFKVIERRKNAAQRSRAMKDTAKRAKREKLEETGSKSVAKHVRLTLGNCSQDDTSNSNSDVSRLSPANLPSSLDNESQIMNVNSKRSTTITSTGIVSNQQGKIRSRNNSSKESSPGSVLSLPPAMKLDIDLDSLPRTTSVNNISAVSSGDESLTLLSGGTADVTMPSPLSPINSVPLLPTHKYTYANKKRSVLKGVTRKEYLSWESPMSDHTQSSSDDEVDEDDEEDEEEEEEEDEDKEDDDDEDEEPEDDEEISVSSIGESLSSQAEESPTNITKASNGLEDNSKSVASNYRAYLSNQDKLKVNARVVLNRSDTKSSLLKRTKNDSGTMSSDKTSEPSDDESSNRHTRHETSSLATNCRARRSSLRGHVKKGCACCNGSPERPKKKSVKLDHKSKKRLGSKQLIKKR